ARLGAAALRALLAPGRRGGSVVGNRAPGRAREGPGGGQGADPGDPGRDGPAGPVEAGLDTAEAVPGAELLVVDGMGHDLPRAVWPPIVDRISALTARA